jgi:hypothetical protein
VLADDVPRRHLQPVALRWADFVAAVDYYRVLLSLSSSAGICRSIYQFLQWYL